MKKALLIVLTLIMVLSSVPVLANAEENNSNASFEYEIDGTEYTIEFSNSSFDAEKQEMIARRIVGLEVTTIQPRNLLCDIFGHKETTENVTAIVHKVYDTAPRCLTKTFRVTTCSRCDYYKQTLISSEYRYCCAED